MLLETEHDGQSDSKQGQHISKDKLCFSVPKASRDAGKLPPKCSDLLQHFIFVFPCSHS